MRKNPYRIDPNLGEEEALKEIVKKLEWVSCDGDDYLGIRSAVLDLRDAVIEYLKERGIEGD